MANLVDHTITLVIGEDSSTSDIGVIVSENLVAKLLLYNCQNQGLNTTVIQSEYLRVPILVRLVSPRYRYRVITSYMILVITYLSYYLVSNARSPFKISFLVLGVAKATCPLDCENHKLLV